MTFYKYIYNSLEYIVLKIYFTPKIFISHLNIKVRKHILTIDKKQWLSKFYILHININPFLYIFQINENKLWQYYREIAHKELITRSKKKLFLPTSAVNIIQLCTQKP